MQLQELYRIGKDKLKNHFIETPGLEAYLLLSKSDLVNDFSQVYSNAEKEIDSQSVDNFQKLLERRIQREPAAYILGEKEFYSKAYKVNSSVLIPRAETELLVDQTLDILDKMQSALILEIGTGSGCIATSIVCYSDDAKVVATDISMDAIAVAKKNCSTHGQSGRVSFLRTDLLKSIKSNTFDIVVSNPPYIRDAEFSHLEPEVRDYEPKAALVAGADGLKYVREIIFDSSRVLKNGGSCVIEIGQGQLESVVSIFKEYGFVDISHVKDLNGIQRVVRAKWKR